MPELGLFHHPSLSDTRAALRAQIDGSDGRSALASELQEVLLDSLARLAANDHGDFTRWATAIAQAPCPQPTPAPRWRNGPAVTLPGIVDDDAQATLIAQLEALHPWRKGPFQIGSIHIDTEWRSDFKWDRIDPAVTTWLKARAGQRILDVGCGNGYFGWRLLAAGAGLVVGIDPTLLFALQHLLINRWAGSDHNWVLPLRLEDLPPVGTFDGALSMGVLYHRRDAAAHLQQLHQQLQPGGWLLLETLVVEGEPIYPARNRGRYARMRNVWCVPDQETLCRWLTAAGFEEPRCIDSTITTLNEQRSTAWMRFESLAEALDPRDESRTIEGWPRPRRAVFAATRR
ncbi:MAG: tRNA 5-methoxyuridine(34)/uridine 5-oxyacetic acid(34) synthase CmoB [Pseudomonadota bacterium]